MPCTPSPPCVQDNHEKCMEFIKTLHQANHALVDAYEKSMKQQRMEKKQMREELKTQLARVRAPEVCACHSVPCFCTCAVMREVCAGAHLL